MDLELAGKSAVVTGAARGIGLAITRTLTAHGARVLAADIDPTTDLAALDVTVLRVDLAAPDGPAQAVNAAVAEFGGLDILINNVGGPHDAAPTAFLDIDDERWRAALELNLMSAVRACRAALPSLIERRGAIVNISSANARVPGPLLDYGVAKAALTNLSKALAEQFGPHGVRVNTVSPAPVRTRVWEAPHGTGAALARAAGMTHPDFLAAFPRMAGMLTGRFVEPDEVADLVAYLASPRSASLCGADYRIDAGGIKTT